MIICPISKEKTEDLIREEEGIKCISRRKGWE